jgi:hypothetical protein
MRLPTVLALWLALTPPAFAAVAPQEAAPREALWKTVLLAPARVVGHGRFDAALPSYHERRAAAKAEAAAARADRCAACPCSPKR